jgi:hypothetical protein
LEVISHTTKLAKRLISGNPVWQAYLESKQERQEVYRRLGNF